MSNTIDEDRSRAEQHLAKRYRAERRFRRWGLLSIIFGISCLAFLMFDIVGKGFGGFFQTYLSLEVELDPEQLDIQSDRANLAEADYRKVLRMALRKHFPEVSGRRDLRKLYALISVGAEYQLRDLVLSQPDLIGREIRIDVLSSDDLDVFYKSWDYTPDGVKVAHQGRLNDAQVTWILKLQELEALELRFNSNFFKNGDSRAPEMAGIRGALMGSLLTLLVTFALSFPIGVAAAVYLEEYAPKGRLTDLIEININNLAAVPSIIFGLLGLAIFIGVFEMQRSLPLVGGLVLTLMTLPTIIISSRAALKAVSPSLREAALGLGASKMQVILHHVLPVAMPTMLTGAIIGMAQALGETAPLLMIGMVAFVVDVPAGITDPATVLPVQIFLWSDSPERAFVEKTSAAIMVLLAFLVLMNASAVWLRRKLEKR